jgi:hypothetical protein
MTTTTTGSTTKEEGDWDINGLNIILMEELTGLNTDEAIKIPRRELLLKCHDRYVRKLKNSDFKDIDRQAKFLNMFLFPVVKDMVEIVEQERKFREKSKK